MRSIIMFDISPLLFECYPDVGNVHVIQSEGGLPSIVRVGVIALIRNTQGVNACFFIVVITSVVKF